MVLVKFLLRRWNYIYLQFLSVKISIRPYQTLTYVVFLVQGGKPQFWVWLAMEVVLSLGLNVSGVYTKYLSDRSQRKAFLETRRALEMRCRTHQENLRQEKLLLSGQIAVT